MRAMRENERHKERAKGRQRERESRRKGKRIERGERERGCVWARTRLLLKQRLLKG